VTRLSLHPDLCAHLRALGREMDLTPSEVVAEAVALLDLRRDAEQHGTVLALLHGDGAWQLLPPRARERHDLN